MLKLKLYEYIYITIITIFFICLKYKLIINTYYAELELVNIITTPVLHISGTSRVQKVY